MERQSPAGLVRYEIEREKNEMIWFWRALISLLVLMAGSVIFLLAFVLSWILLGVNPATSGALGIASFCLFIVYAAGHLLPDWFWGEEKELNGGESELG